MFDLDTSLREALRHRDDAGLLRRLRVVACHGPMARLADGRALLNLASNDYLALSQHPQLIEASRDAASRWGVGAGASRLVTGHSPVHAEAEAAFAAFKGAEAATLLPTGYMANLAAITALAGPGDLVCLDKLCHASLIDAARLSGATVRTYPHLNLDRLDTLLARHRKEHPDARRITVSDTVFSMDGDVADLPAVCDVAEWHDAVVLIDEAHGTGVLGERGTGLAELQGVEDRVHVTVSTASKALGGLGGVVSGSRAVIDTILNEARPFIYTTGVPASQAAAVTAAIEVVRDEPWRRERVLEIAARVWVAALDAGFELPPTRVVTPIVPLVVGEAGQAEALAERLRERGVLAPSIRPPTVPRGGARVRLSLRADLDDAMVGRLVEVVGAVRDEAA